MKKGILFTALFSLLMGCGQKAPVIPNKPVVTLPGKVEPGRQEPDKPEPADLNTEYSFDKADIRSVVDYVKENCDSMETLPFMESDPIKPAGEYMVYRKKVENGDLIYDIEYEDWSPSGTSSSGGDFDWKVNSADKLRIRVQTKKHPFASEGRPYIICRMEDSGLNELSTEETDVFQLFDVLPYMREGDFPHHMKPRSFEWTLSQEKTANTAYQRTLRNILERIG